MTFDPIMSQVARGGASSSPIASRVSALSMTEWHKFWEEGKADWHKTTVDDRLQLYLKDLTGGKPGVSILVTWCGKSVDLPWLCSQGYNVVGIELCEVAVKQLFEENSIPYSVQNEDKFVIYQATDRPLKVINGDYYEVTPEIAGSFEAVWDIHALGAADSADRGKYISVLASLLKPRGKILLCNWEYPDVRDKAPFSIPSSLVKELFGDKFDFQYLGSRDTYSAIFMSAFKQDWAAELFHLLTYKI